MLYATHINRQVSYTRWLLHIVRGQVNSRAEIYDTTYPSIDEQLLIIQLIVRLIVRRITSALPIFSTEHEK